jgi:hypothetical protein
VSSELAGAAHRLRERCPYADEATVHAVLNAAMDTVLRVVGRRDVGLAEDLAQLRLDVRRPRAASHS